MTKLTGAQIAAVYAQIDGAPPRRRPTLTQLEAAMAAAHVHLVPTDGDPPVRVVRDDDPILDRVVTVVVRGNPKRAKTASHQRFGCYRTGQTVRQYHAACNVPLGKALADVRWDADHGYITLR